MKGGEQCQTEGDDEDDACGECDAMMPVAQPACQVGEEDESHRSHETQQVDCGIHRPVGAEGGKVVGIDAETCRTECRDGMEQGRP